MILLNFINHYGLLLICLAFLENILLVLMIISQLIEKRKLKKIINFMSDYLSDYKIDGWEKI